MSTISKKDIMKIIDDAGVRVDINKIESDESLTDAGVDSLELSLVLLGIEEKYDIKIPDEDIEKLMTIDEIIKYLSEKMTS